MIEDSASLLKVEAYVTNIDLEALGELIMYLVY